MSHRQTPRHAIARQSGFSMLELLITIAVIGIAATIGMPALQHVLLNNKVLGAVNQVNSDLMVAKQEAIKRGVPVVVSFDTTQQSLRAFADVPDDLGNQDLVYTPDPAKPHRAADYVVFDHPLPRGRSDANSIRFSHPVNAADRIQGFTTVNSEPHLVFQPNGSVRATGSFVIGDFRGPYADVAADRCSNCFRLNVQPQATGRVFVEKYRHENPNGWLRNARTFTDDNRDRSTGGQWKWY